MFLIGLLSGCWWTIREVDGKPSSGTELCIFTTWLLLWQYLFIYASFHHFFSFGCTQDTMSMTAIVLLKIQWKRLVFLCYASCGGLLDLWTSGTIETHVWLGFEAQHLLRTKARGASPHMVEEFFLLVLQVPSMFIVTKPQPCLT